MENGKKRRGKPKAEQNGSVTVDVPVKEPEEGVYYGRHVELQLDQVQAYGLRRAFDALHSQGARLENGRYIQTNADVVRWVFEQIGRA